MIMKARKIPVIVQVLEMLLKRLSSQHFRRAEIEDDYSKYVSGYKGEQSLDFYLDDLPQKDYLIFYNLRIFQNKSFFQLDILILTQSYFLIIEVKNFSGTLYFDQDLYQLIRTINGSEETFADPISQVRRQQYCLHDWLRNHQITNIPIESLVVVSNPQTQIKVSPGRPDIYKLVTHKTHLPERIRFYDQKHREERLSKKELRKLSKLLLKYHTSATPNLIQRYQISAKDLIKGVACPRCDTIPMVRNKRKWFCPSCDLYSKSAHIQALKDYSLLIHPTITNSQCREFLRLDSRITAKNMLNALNLPTSGHLRHKKYHLEFEDLKE